MSTIKTTNIQHPSAASPAVELTAAGGLWLGGGKILQVVRATDSTQRSTTSTSFVDITGMSVTITPQKSDSAVLLIATMYTGATRASGSAYGRYQITDSSNNPISGAEDTVFGVTSTISGAFLSGVRLFAYATPATTSAVTYKVRFKVDSSSITLDANNHVSTGQMYAIEVSA